MVHFFFFFHFILQPEPEKCYVSGYDNANLLGMHYRTCKSFLAAYHFSMLFRYVLCFDVYGRLNDSYVDCHYFQFHVKLKRNMSDLERIQESLFFREFVRFYNLIEVAFDGTVSAFTSSNWFKVHC